MRPTREQIVPDPHASVKLFRRQERRFCFEWHTHAEAELTLIVRGSGRRFVGDAVDRYAPGDLVLLPGGLPHSWSSDEDSDLSEAVVAQFMVDTLEPWPELRPVRALLERAAGGLSFTAPALAARFEALTHTTGLGRWVGFIELLHDLALLDGDRATPMATAGYTPPPSVTDERAQRVLDLVSERFRGQLRQAEVAESVGMSPSVFVRYFQRLTGLTFTDFVQRTRVAEASRRLAETEDRVTDIAFASGFQNLSHFNCVFRKRMGCTPTAYRRHHAA